MQSMQSVGQWVSGRKDNPIPLVSCVSVTPNSCTLDSTHLSPSRQAPQRSSLSTKPNPLSSPGDHPCQRSWSQSPLRHTTTTHGLAVKAQGPGPGADFLCAGIQGQGYQQHRRGQSGGGGGRGGCGWATFELTPRYSPRARPTFGLAPPCPRAIPQTPQLAQSRLRPLRRTRPAS